jgi:hypothetical protein
MHPDLTFAPIHYCQCHLPPSFRPAGERSTSEAKSVRGTPSEGESIRHASRPCFCANPPPSMPPSTLFPACRREGQRAKQSWGESTRHASRPCIYASPLPPMQFFHPLSGLPERRSTSEAKSAQRAPLPGESTRHASRPCFCANPLLPMPLSTLFPACRRRVDQRSKVGPKGSFGG